MDYWSKDKILSYNKLFNFVIGARGIGKTYSCKDWAIKDYIRTGHKTCWGMRYIKEIDKAINHNKFFSDILDKYEDYEFKIENYTGFMRYIKDAIDPKDIPWEPFITFYALSERSLKAISDPDVNKIILDEFMPLPGIPYLKGEVERFIEYYYTISRATRNVRAVFIGNSTSIVSPYFSYFGVKAPKPGKISASEEIAIENAKNVAFEQAMYNTRFGKLINNTHYAKYAIENESLLDLTTFVVPRDKKARCLVRIKTTMKDMWLWIYKCNVWVSLRGDSNAPIWSIGDAAHTEGAERADFAGSIGRKIIRSHYANGTLYFDSDEAKAIFMSTCMMFTK